MIHSSSPVAIIIFLAFISVVLGISFYLGAKAKSSKGYFTAGGTIHWAVNGIAFAGDYLSAASFLGICGMIAFFGYDGFLYSIGYLAGWIVALFIIAEPLKRLGRYTFADALDNKFNSRSIKLTAAISTLVVSIFYLIPQMVGAGALVQPLLGFPHYVGVIIVGLVVITIVVTAGMVSTTWVQFIKGSLLVCLCFVITIMILNRGISTEPKKSDGTPVKIFKHDLSSAEVIPLPGDAQRELIPPSEGWVDKPYVRILDKTSGEVSVWRKEEGDKYFETQTMVAYKDGRKMANGKPHGKGEGQGDLSPVGYAYALPGGVKETGPLGPLSFIQTMQSSNVILWGSDKIMEQDGTATTVYYQRPSPGSDFMTPGSSPTFKKVRSKKCQK